MAIVTCATCGEEVFSSARRQLDPSSGEVSGCPACSDAEDLTSGPVEEEPAGPRTLQVRIRKQRFKASDSAYAAYSVVVDGNAQDLPEAATRDFIASGNLGAWAPGDIVTIMGDFETHPKYGFQFAAKGPAVLAVRESQTALMSFLMRLPQVGIVRAGEILRKFGNMSGTLDVLDNHPERLTEVSGITPERAAEIKAQYDEALEARDFILWATSVGIPEPIQASLLEAFESPKEAQEALLADPYETIFSVMAEATFKTADEVAEALDIPIKDPRRVSAALVRAISDNEGATGNTFATFEAVAGLPLIKKLELDSDALMERLELLTKPRSSRRHGERPPYLSLTDGTEHGSKVLVWRHETFCAERAVADNLKRLLQAPVEEVTYRPEIWGEIQPAPEQEEAVRLALKTPVMVLTGGPGVGKTMTTKAILAALETVEREPCLVAPTGKAAKRMTELTERPASTIHRTLAMQKSSNDKFFVQSKVVLVDETSMVDTHLCADLLASIRSKSRVIFVGDVDQLPSIGPGQVFRDMIESGTLPTVRLTRVFRQQSDGTVKRIPDVAKAINSGVLPDLALKGTNVAMLQVSDVEQLGQKVVWAATEALTQKYGFAPNDIQVIVPQRGEQGKANWPIGARALNLALQEKLNPLQPGAHEVHAGDGYVIREKSKVVQRKNVYPMQVVNGDVGVVVRTSKTPFVPSPDVVTMARSVAKETGRPLSPDKDVVLVVVAYPHAMVGYTKVDLRNLQLSYAITTHVSQGSGYPAVVIPVHRVNGFMLTRQLLYTAVTRAEKHVLLIGEVEAVEAAIKNTRGALRQTQLQAKLVLEE